MNNEAEVTQQNSASDFLQATQFLKAGRPAEAFDLLSAAWNDLTQRKPHLGLALISASVQSGKFSEARAVICTGRSLWPNDLRFIVASAQRDLAEGYFGNAVEALTPLDSLSKLPINGVLVLSRALNRLKQWDDALDVLRRFEINSGGSAAISKQRALILIEAQRLTDAEAELTAASINWPEDSDIWRYQARVLIRQRRFSDAIEAVTINLNGGSPAIADCFIFLRACIAGGCFGKLEANLPRIHQISGIHNTFPLIKLIVAAVNGQENEVADIVQAFTSPLSDEIRQEIKFAIPELIKGMQLAAASLLTRSLQKVDPDFSWLRTIGIKIAAMRGQRQEALEAATDLYLAKKIGPGDQETLLELLAEIEAGDLFRAIYADYKLQQKAPTKVSPAHCLLFAEYLLSIGDSASAAAELDQLPLLELSPALKLRALSIRSNLGETAKQDDCSIENAIEIPPDDVLEEGLVSHYRFSNEFCVIWFAGVVPSNLVFFQKYCLSIWRKFGISVLTISDTKRLASLGGFGRYFPKRHSAKNALSQIINQFGYKGFATSGNSLAGFSAMLYGCEMGALGSLVFASPSRIPHPSEMSDSRGLMSLHRVRRSLELETSDILASLQANPKMIVHQHFGLLSDFDREQAMRMKELANVYLFGSRHDSHAVLEWLCKNDQIEECIQRFVDEVFGKRSIDI